MTKRKYVKERTRLSQADLCSSIGADRLPVEDLHLLLLSRYNGTRTYLNSDEYFIGSSQEAAVRLIYTRKWKLGGLLRGPAFPEGDVFVLRRMIDQELETSRTSKYHSAILFSGQQLVGFYRYKNELQVLPLPEDGPRAEIFVSPFILEFAYSDTTVELLRSTKIWRRQAELELLLSLLVDAGIHSNLNYGSYNPVGFAWFYDVGGASAPSRFAQLGYSYPGHSSSPEEFSATNHLEPVNRLLTGSGGHPWELCFPPNFDLMINAYFSLSQKNKELLIRSAYWLQQATAIRATSPSLSIQASAQAIEALLPEVPSGSPCDKCGSLPGRSIAARFSSFVDGLLGGSISAEERKRFYAVRSSVAHGKTLIDANIGLGGAKSSHGNFDVGHFRQISRTVVQNWLLQKDIIEGG